ncbi:hypothetical protein BGZ94_005215 [Podila epigama]|nr:hypothetical protein BGZ94_005215 [Podila epigama]
MSQQGNSNTSPVEGRHPEALSTTSLAQPASTARPTSAFGSTAQRSADGASAQGAGPSSAATNSTRPSASDQSGTSLSTTPSFGTHHYPQPRHSTDQQQPQLQFNHQHLHLHHLPLPEREDSSRPRPITFGTLKKASMSTVSSLQGSGAGGASGKNGVRKSKMTSLPNYLRHTTFFQYFQPEGVTHGAGPISTLPVMPGREHSKRRRLIGDINSSSSGSSRRHPSHRSHSHHYHHHHHHHHSDSGSSRSSDSSSEGSDSGHNSAHEYSDTATPTTERAQSLRFQLPTRWSTIDKTEKTELLEDDLMALANSIAMLQPLEQTEPFLHSVEFIISKYIGIGVCNAGVALDRLPGWEPLSWGYHGDDGNSFGGCGNGRPFGPVFTTGDTIGCGVNFRDMSLFYTKNGRYLGVAFRDLKGSLYPTVGMRTVGEIIEANFGQREFMFDIEEYVKDEKVEAWQSLEDKLEKATVEQNRVGVLSQNLSELVLSYMLHHGYADTARQFSRDLAPPHAATSHVPHRGGRGPQDDVIMAPVLHEQERASSAADSHALVDAERRKTILAGEIDKAIAMLEEQYPEALLRNEDMLLQLRCRKFVEMVTNSSASLKALDKKENRRGGGHKGKGHSVKLQNPTAESMDLDPSSEQASKLKDSKNKGMVAQKANCHEKVEQEDLDGLGHLKDAIKYGQYLQEQYKHNRRSSVQDMLIDAFSVLAYSDMDNGDSDHSSAETRETHQVSKAISRQAVAETVNKAILASQNMPTTAPLETVHRQTRVLLTELTRRGVGEAAFFDCL